MPIDPSVALGATLPEFEFSWTESDVLLYHLAVTAPGIDQTSPRELQYAYEKDLHVLPSFAVVAPTLHATAAPKVSYPGIEINLVNVVHGSQKIVVHRPLPTSGSARAQVKVAEIWDKGSAAVVVTETAVTALDGSPLWTNISSIFAKNEGGFGGERGPSTKLALPDRAPDHIVTTPTLTHQALLYRLLGDRNPLHVDPEFAAAAGFPAPILHGLGTYGLVAKSLVDTLLDGDVARVQSIGVRFAGVVYPGETLSTSVWREDGRFVFVTTVPERDNAPALADAELVIG